MSPFVPKVGFNGRSVCDCTLTMISYYADADLQNSRYPIAIAMTAIRSANSIAGPTLVCSTNCALTKQRWIITLWAFSIRSD